MKSATGKLLCWEFLTIIVKNITKVFLVAKHSRLASNYKIPSVYYSKRKIVLTKTYNLKLYL